MNNKYLILKIAGFLGLIISVIGLIFLILGFGDFESNKFTIGMFLMPIGIFIGFVCLFNGYKPKIRKKNLERIKEFQEKHKEELKDITLSQVDIAKDAIKETVKIINDKEENKMFCKYCGKEIDVDSQFCKHCGKGLF